MDEREIYLENFIIFRKIGDFDIFSKKVVFSKLVTDRMKRTIIWDHKGYNMEQHHTFIFFYFLKFCQNVKLPIFLNKGSYLGRVTDRAKRKQIWGTQGL